MICWLMYISLLEHDSAINLYSLYFGYTELTLCVIRGYKWEQSDSQWMNGSEILLRSLVVMEMAVMTGFNVFHIGCSCECVGR